MNTRTFRLAGPLFLAIYCILAPGCGSSDDRPRISGKVTYKGAPVAKMNLAMALDAAAGESFSQSFPLDEAGKFSGELPQAGSYKVIIQESYAAMEGNAARSKKGSVPPKYRWAKSTDITWTVKSGDNSRDIELKD